MRGLRAAVVAVFVAAYLLLLSSPVTGAGGLASVLDEYQCDRTSLRAWDKTLRLLQTQPLPAARGLLAITLNPSRVSNGTWRIIDHFLARHFRVEAWAYTCTNQTVLLRDGRPEDRVRLVRRESLTPCPVSCQTPMYKFAFAKLYLTPERAAQFSAVYLWDDDLDLSPGFDADTSLKLAYALDADGWQTGVDGDGHTHAQRSQEFDLFWEAVEIQQPAYTPALWACLWTQVLDPWGWGLEAAMPCNCAAARLYVFARLRITHESSKTDAAPIAIKLAGAKLIAANRINPRRACVVPQGLPSNNRCLRIVEKSAAERAARVSVVAKRDPAAWRHPASERFFNSCAPPSPPPPAKAKPRAKTDTKPWRHQK